MNTRKIITRGVIDIATGRVLEEDSFMYRGRVARCGDAYNLQDLKQVFPLIPAAVNAAAPTTGSGSWVDISNWVGDGIIVVDLAANVGGFGSVKVQLQTATNAAGAGAANFTLDSRNSGLLTMTALGTYVMVFDTDAIPTNFLGCACTYTTVTSATFGVTALGRIHTN
jgi:hypothetical protein